MKKHLPRNRRNRRQLKNEIEYLNWDIRQTEENLYYHVNKLKDCRNAFSKRNEIVLCLRDQIENHKEELKVLKENEILRISLLEYQKKQTTKYKFWSLFWAAITVIFISLFIITGFIQILLSL